MPRARAIAMGIGGNLLLVAVCLVVLYPVLWVLKIALSGSEALQVGALPLPNRSSGT